MTVTSQTFDTANNITQYTIANRNQSLVVKIIDYGATITNLLVNDKNGKQRDVVLGFDNFDGYLGKQTRNPYFGAVIGRVGNRIANGKFNLNGKTYSLPINNGVNSLHGGNQGFDKRKWTLKGTTDNSITFEYISEDGEEGYPSALKATITYTVTDNNALNLDYSAELLSGQTENTIVNLTNHTYFNLNGCTNKDEVSILNHSVTLKANHFLEVNEALIPTGKLLSTVTDNPLMDFSTSGDNAHTIGERIASIKPNGYDHCYAIDTNESNYNVEGRNEFREAVAVVRSPITGIRLTMSTSEPAFQFYSGNFLTDALKTKSNQSAVPIQLGKNSGFCLEAQRFPNSINIENWRKLVILSPGQRYSQKTSYRFDSN